MKQLTCKRDAYHCPEVVGHLLSVLQDSPQKKISPRVLTALVHIRKVLVTLKETTFASFFLWEDKFLKDLLLMRLHFNR